MAWVLFVLALLVGPAESHSWYESACCGGTDCAPVPDGVVVNTKEGVMVAGFGLLSYTDPRLRWSRDDHDHVCASHDLPPKLHCIYRKPTFF